MLLVLALGCAVVAAMIPPVVLRRVTVAHCRTDRSAADALALVLALLKPCRDYSVTQRREGRVLLGCSFPTSLTRLLCGGGRESLAVSITGTATGSIAVLTSTGSRGRAAAGAVTAALTGHPADVELVRALSRR